MGNAGLKQHYETATKTGVLQISNHKLREIPTDVLNLRDFLRNLDISHNKLVFLPENINKLKSLKHLNVESNRLQSLPNTLGDMQKLEILNVSCNRIKMLPSCIKNLQNLKQVYLNSNKFTEFPTQLFTLKHLDVVELSNNNITLVPKGMADFYAIELNLNQNQITTIAEDLHEAPRLKILKLEENCLNMEAISCNLLRNSKIHTLSLEGNLFEVKNIAAIEGFNEYMERYTAVKKKMF